MSYDDYIECDKECQEAENKIARLQARIKELEEYSQKRQSMSEYDEGWMNGNIAGLEKHRWIPVSERLPKESGYYQINQYPTTREYSTKSLVGNQWYSNDTVTHWKPIMKPNN